MLTTGAILCLGLGYIMLLFGIAYYADRRADQQRSIISNPYIYSLSLAVYCTAWTFYGSVGHAARTGFAFLPVYLGPTLAFLLGGVVIRKILRISKVHRITSIADLISSRYGKSALIGGLVTLIAVLGIVPYIALQLKAISRSFTILLQYPDIIMPTSADTVPFWQDTAFQVALLLAAFTILFGTRHLDASERHEGMVAAIALESVVKLVAYISVGLFVTFGIYGSLGAELAQARAAPQPEPLLAPVVGDYGDWFFLSLLSYIIANNIFRPPISMGQECTSTFLISPEESLWRNSKNFFSPFLAHSISSAASSQGSAFMSEIFIFFNSTGP